MVTQLAATDSALVDDRDVRSFPPNRLGGALRQLGRVLLVDDEPSVARVLQRMLVGKGYDVTAVQDGRGAIETAASVAFDVIVSDIQMPDIDGLALLRAIRARDLDIPVVFLTGSPKLQTAVEAIEYGAFRYLTKPVAPEDLFDVVARAISWHRLALVRREAAREVQGRMIGDRAGLETRFDSALDKLWMATQPIVSTSRGTIVAYEALLRTDEPAMLNPMHFFDAAERLGRTVELGRAVRTRVAEAMRSVPDVRVFVNLHPAELEDPELLDDDGVLTPFADRIVIEVSEKTALDQIPGFSDCVARLRELGFRLALDDLGAGYAGLSSFARVEPDVVKVDMSLVRAIEQSVVKQKLFRTVAALCRDLHADLIAEGVETTEERDCLLRLGGDLFQGFLFARPDRGFSVVGTHAQDGLG